MTASRYAALGRLSSSYRDAVSTVALTWSLVAMGLATLVVGSRAAFGPAPSYSVELFVLLSVSALSYVFRARLTPNSRSVLAAGVFFAAGASSLLKTGPTGYAPFFLTMAVTLLGLCFGMRAWMWGCAGVIVFATAVGMGITAGWVQPSYLVPEFLRTPVEFVLVVLLVVLMSVLLLQIVLALVGELNVRTAELGDRVKELSALHGTSRLLQQERPVDGALLEEVAALLPPAWQYPEICEARIGCGGMEVKTPRWQPTRWMQSAEFTVGDDPRGRIDVVYLEERPLAAEGPFLSEERSLIQSLADMLASHLERSRNERVLREASARHERYESALEVLCRYYVQPFDDVNALLRHVCEAVASAMRIERVSVWRFVQEGAVLSCRHAFDRRRAGDAAEIELARNQYPDYFRALEASDVIDAHDARLDSRTRGLSDAYLIPLGITATLDVPIGGQGRAQGVLCAEHLDGPRRWEPDEQTFLIAVANLVSALLAQIERQAMERQLRQAQKLEAIGTLAGGIAHDFNNILSAMNGYAELARIDIGDDAAVLAHLEAIAQGGARGAKLVRQILTFSRRQEQERIPTELGPVVTEVVTLLNATLPATIEIVTTIAPDLPLVLADATEVHQVLMNLCTNAWHAMHERPGRLEVRLEALVADADFAEAHPPLTTGDYVRLSVGDTGHGMDADTMARIFEPFFTTKGPQVGTGLGLSVVHGIMQAHDGAITVYSQPGEGTTFHLYFPAHASDAAPVVERQQELPRGDGQRVLFVDDEVPLAHMGRKMLERLGYVVTAVTSPAEALAIFSANPQSFDLVFTDLTMPGRSGTDLAADMIARRHDLRIVLVTGYTTLTSERVRRLGIRELALKPLTLHRLATIAQRALAP